MQHKKKGRRITMTYNCPKCGEAMVYVREFQIDPGAFWSGWACERCAYSVEEEKHDER